MGLYNEFQSGKGSLKRMAGRSAGGGGRGDLFFCNYPLYTIATLASGKFYVAGGGGQQKTGVPNGFELRSVNHEGDWYSSKLILQHDMGSDLIMNSEPHPKDDSVIAVGIGHSNHLLKIEQENDQDCVNLTTLKSVRTDFSEKDSYQKIVRFNFDGSLLVTGGCDGTLRVWKYPDMKDKVELRGHSNEIEDIACHANENRLVSVCRGGEALVWDIARHKQLKQFTWQPDKFRLKSCKFSPKKDAEGKFWLYSISVPLKITQWSKKQWCIVKWCTVSWRTHLVRAVVKGLACTMAINSDGSKIAVGTTEGSISIFNHELQGFCDISNIHSVFVTGLTFVKLEKESPKKQELNNEILLSISADRTCSVSTLNKKSGFCDFRFCFFVLLPIFFVFICISVSAALLLVP